MRYADTWLRVNVSKPILSSTSCHFLENTENDLKLPSEFDLSGMTSVHNIEANKVS